MAKHAFRMLLVAGLLARASWAADDPFVGKWKLNPSKSRFPDKMKVESAGTNKYTFDFIGGNPETIVTDGTDQPGIFGTTLAVSVEAPDTWKVVRKKDGKALLTAIWKLSKDGKTISDSFRQTDGVSMDYVYERTTPGSGFAATWDSVSEKMNTPYELEINLYEGDGLTFITPTDKQTRNVKFDEKDHPVTGPDVSPGAVSSGRRVNEHSLKVTYTRNGKLRETREIELSPDGKSLTMTVHPAGQDKPNVQVFDRE